MVGWMPWDMRIRKALADQFVDRAKKCQDFRPHEVPLILQYDERYGDMRPWLWPVENGVRIRPDQLDRYRYTHFFKAPCCPCTFVKGSPFSETKFGLAQIISQPATPHCLGQYVAICSTQECGYLIVLERYFSHPELMTAEYSRRDEPIKVMDPFLFMTDDTEETIKKTGLRQIRILGDQSNTGLRGTNKLLRREDPEQFFKLQDSMEALMAKGLPADRFWDLFVQCTGCNYVMPRHYFPYYHACVVHIIHPQLGLPRRLPPPKVPTSSASSHSDDSDMDDTALPGPASSDDNLQPDAVVRFCTLLAHTQANQAEPVTPKARR